MRLLIEFLNLYDCYYPHKLSIKYFSIVGILLYEMHFKYCITVIYIVIFFKNHCTWENHSPDNYFMYLDTYFDIAYRIAYIQKNHVVWFILGIGKY